MTSAQSLTRQPWQSPFVVVACGCLVAMLTFGPRTTLGLVLPSMSRDTGWTRDVFALGIAIQHLVWGLGQPFAGAIADRMGTLRALGTGALVYSLGLAVMANATAPAVLYAAGALVGLGLAGASFNIVLAAFGKLLTERWRPLATGFGGAAGSFGQFLFSPFCILLLENGWRTPLLVFGAMLLLVVPLSVPLATTAHGREEAMGSSSVRELRQVFGDALRRSSYLLLLAGYFVTGVHVAFINLHLPAHLQDGGLDRPSAGWVIATIGLFNIAGSLGAGWLCGRFPNRYVLFAIYLLRALAIAGFLLAPLSAATALLFAASMGLLWASSVTPVAGIVTRVFGTADLAALYGLAFFAHQLGAFLGVWVGGLVFEGTDSYAMAWWALVAGALAASSVTLLIDETPRDRDSQPPYRGSPLRTETA
jgi:MFS family permease